MAGKFKVSVRKAVPNLPVRHSRRSFVFLLEDKRVQVSTRRGNTRGGRSGGSLTGALIGFYRGLKAPITHASTLLVKLGVLLTATSGLLRGATRAGGWGWILISTLNTSKK